MRSCARMLQLRNSRSKNEKLNETSEWHLARFHAVEEARLGQDELECVGTQLVVGARLRLHLHELAQVALRQLWAAVSMQQLWNIVSMQGSSLSRVQALPPRQSPEGTSHAWRHPRPSHSRVEAETVRERCFCCGQLVFCGSST